MSDLLTQAISAREPLQESFSDARNPLRLDGVEFIEFATSKPQALGQTLEMMGFRPIARHRSREVLLYRQGGLNIVVNAHAQPGTEAAAGAAAPSISAIGLRVRDASAAYHDALEKGAWEIPPRVGVMELHIPGIHGVGGSRIHFVDRYNEFSIYDVDFVPIPTVDPHPPAIAGAHFFGVVQYIGFARSNDWIEFYAELFGGQPVPDAERFGIMPKGKLLRMPALQESTRFMIQLVEPEPFASDGAERLHRIGLGVPDVMVAVQALRARGVEFIETDQVHTERRGAISKTYMGSVVFELVHSAVRTEPL